MTCDRRAALQLRSVLGALQRVTSSGLQETAT